MTLKGSAIKIDPSPRLPLINQWDSGSNHWRVKKRPQSRSDTESHDANWPIKIWYWVTWRKWTNQNPILSHVTQMDQSESDTESRDAKNSPDVNLFGTIKFLFRSRIFPSIKILAIFPLKNRNLGYTNLDIYSCRFLWSIPICQWDPEHVFPKKAATLHIPWGDSI
jgi:hypothetical protein